MSYSFHHGLYTKSTWESQSSTKMLRNNQWLIMPLDEQVHRALQDEIPVVPVLGHNTAQKVLRDFEPVAGNYIASMFALMGTINEAGKHPRARPIERELGQLTINALELQIPYIQDGLVEVPYVETQTRTQDFQRGTW